MIKLDAPVIVIMCPILYYIRCKINIRYATNNVLIWLPMPDISSIYLTSVNNLDKYCIPKDISKVAEMYNIQGGNNEQ